MTLILEALDVIKWILAELERTQAEPDGDDSVIIAKLDAAASGELVSDREPATAAGVMPEGDAPPAGGEILVDPESAQDSPSEDSVEQSSAEAKREPQTTKDSGNSHREAGAQSIRVGVDLLENLMTLVSELVLTRNQLLQMVRGHDDSEFSGPLQRLSHITTDLQEGVMKTRMQPIGNAWAKLPRIIRDLSVETGKKIDLRMHGAETELDRQVLELIKDPLTHMVRNSADHGLEMPDARRAAGKPEIGVVELDAYHEGGHIIIKIADDGKGLDIARIRQKAISNGLGTEAEITAMTDQQIAQFIFKAGLSTAEKVTNISGRGVGMDVVKSNIEKIGGTIELSTQPGKGTTFLIKIPLTLAIVPALIVEAAGERFALPQISVVELVMTGKEHHLERVKDARVLRLRDKLLPVVSLRETMGLGECGDDGFVIVTQVGSNLFGIIVDRVFDTEEIVVKPVSPLIRNIQFYSGNTILGDGSVVMILDPNGISSAVGKLDDSKREANALNDAAKTSDMTSLLVFKAGGLKAVPLELVSRLEEIDVSTIEHSAGEPVVQYRGSLMRLVPVEGCRIPTEGKCEVLVFSDRSHTAGLVVEEIVDVVEERLDIKLAASKPGALGTVVVSKRVADLIDTAHYLRTAVEDWFGCSENKESAPQLLFVEDSAFFRNMLVPLLKTKGYEVWTAENGQKALDLLRSGVKFDAVVTDIDMPVMDGFELAAEAARLDSAKGIPFIAMTSRTSKGDIERGRQLGFHDYVAKADRDGLLSALNGVIFERRNAA